MKVLREDGNLKYFVKVLTTCEAFLEDSKQYDHRFENEEITT